MSFKERSTRFCERFGIRVPILLAPMAGASAPSLSIAVINAGGLGACAVGVGGADAVANMTIALPAGNYTALTLLGTGVNGNHPNQTFTVNYSDGSSTSFVQSLSDWFTPQSSYTGESKASQMAYRLTSTGAHDTRTFYLYGYSFPLNSAKTAVSVTLPVVL